MSLTLHGPGAESLELHEDPLATYRAAAPTVAPARLVYAAAHIAFLDSLAEVPANVTGDELLPHIDWKTTLDLRRTLAAHGFAIAEAMDTAQRFQVGWPIAARLIEECGALRLPTGFVAGAGVDHLGEVRSRSELIDGVVFQANHIRSHGGEVILLPLEWLATQGCDEGDYVATYAAIIDELEGPLFVHWLGEMFHPGLAGYFPGKSFERVMAHSPEKVRGAKLSLLDAELEVRLRRELLSRDQLLLTGDDFHFARLLRGGDPDATPATPPPIERTTRVGERTVPLGDFSHGLLGVFDGIFEPASLALRYLAAGDLNAFDELMLPCEAYGQEVFREPTRFYKTGLAFTAWLRGAQSNPMLAGHEETARSVNELWRTVQCAVEARALGANWAIEERWGMAGQR